MPLAETPDAQGAWPRLTDAQIAELEVHGERRTVQDGDVLYREGEPIGELLVIVEGFVELIEGFGRHERTIAVHGPGRFLGEISLLTGQPSFVTAVMREDGAVLTVPVDRLRKVLFGDPVLEDLILRACLVRRSMLLGLGQA